MLQLPFSFWRQAIAQGTGPFIPSKTNGAKRQSYSEQAGRDQTRPETWFRQWVIRWPETSPSQHLLLSFQNLAKGMGNSRQRRDRRGFQLAGYGRMKAGKLAEALAKAGNTAFVLKYRFTLRLRHRWFFLLGESPRPAPVLPGRDSPLQLHLLPYNADLLNQLWGRRGAAYCDDWSIGQR